MSNEYDDLDPTREYKQPNTPPSDPDSNNEQAEAAGGIPRQFGRYQIEKQLGQGGMGAVYLAHDETLDRRVAIKVPSFRHNGDEVVIERFYREAKAAATLDHPNLCPVYDVGVIAGIHYLSMAYIRGRTLSSFIKQGGLPSRQVAALIRKVALALHEAHLKGVVHRDLKPANIMINRRREPVVMDFGLAQRTHTGDVKLTQTGAVVGTPAYMSPEQISTAGPVGPASDIFSLGVIIYQMLVGDTPFKGGDAFAVVGAILTAEPEPPSSRRADLEPEMELICLRALSKKPEDRFGSMLELADALRSFIVGSGLPPTMEYARPQDPPSQTTSVPPVSAAPTAPGAAGQEVSSPPLPPGEETLIKDMFADISSSSGASVRASRKRAARRKRRKWDLWGGIAVAAGVVGISLYLLWPDKDNRLARNQSATSAGPVHPRLSAESPSQNETDISSLSPLSRSNQTQRDATSNSDSSGNALTHTGDSANLDPATKSAAPPADWTTQKSRPSKTPTTSTPKKTSPPLPTATDRPLIVDAKLPADPDSKIRLDGKANDWDAAKATADDLRDALDNDWSRDIIQFASEYTADSLYVMMKTSEPPSTERLAFWVNIDLNDDQRYEFQIGTSGNSKHVFWRSPPNEPAYAENISGLQLAIDEVVEIRIPWEFLRTDLPASMASMLPRDSVPLGVTYQCFSYLDAADKRPDSTNFVVSHTTLTEDQLSAARVAEVKRLGPPKWESIWLRDAQTPWELRSGLTVSALQSAMVSMRRRKLTMICLRGYTGDDGEPRFAALWTTGPATDVAHSLTRQQLEAKLAEGARKRLRPAFVSAWSWNRQPAFNVIWVQDASPVLSTWAFSTSGTLSADYDRAVQSKLGVQGVTGWHGPDGENHYLTLFAKTPLRPGSRIYDEADYRQNVRRLAVNARPLYVDTFRNGNSLYFPVCWTYDNDKLPDWRVESSQGVAVFDDLVTKLKREGYRPLCVAVAR